MGELDCQYSHYKCNLSNIVNLNTVVPAPVGGIPVPFLSFLVRSVFALLLVATTIAHVSNQASAAPSLYYLYGSGSQTGGKQITLRVQLTENAPGGGTTVALTSNDLGSFGSRNCSGSGGQLRDSVQCQHIGSFHRSFSGGLGDAEWSDAQPHRFDQGSDSDQHRPPIGHSTWWTGQSHHPAKRTSTGERVRCRSDR